MAIFEASASGRLPADVAQRHGQDQVVVWCRGQHDMTTVPALAGTMSRAIEQGTSEVVLDLSRVTFMDAAIVGFIVRAGVLLGGSNRLLTLRSPSRCARRVLDACGLEYVDDTVVDLRWWRDGAWAGPVDERSDQSSPAHGSY